MRRFASWTTSHRAIVILGWIVGLIAMGFVAASAGSDFNEEFSLPSSDSKDALDLLENRFPAQAGDTVQIVYKAESGVEAPAVKQKMEGVFAKAAALPHVSEVASPYDKGGAGAVSKDGEIAYATAQFNVTTDKLGDDEVKKIMDAAQAAGGDGLQVEVGGSPAEEVRSEEEESSSEGIGILAAVVVLLVSFGSVVAMGLPILTALFALGVGLSVITLFTHVFNTAEFAPQLAFMIGLGVGVDYALFILTRFRNGLDEGMGKEEAAVAAVDTAGRAVLFAGITVIISLMGMLLLGLPFLYGVATAAAIAVLFTMIAALTLLPALLAAAGNWVNRLRIPFLGRGARSIDEHSWWFRWSERIQRRPWVAALLSGALLLALCIPTLSLRLGTNDAGTDPAGTTTREAYDLLAEGFGPGFNGPFQIVAALPEKGDDAALQELRTDLQGEEGVEAVTDVTLNPDKTVGVFQLYPTTSPQSVETTDLLDRIRDDAIPPVESSTGAQIHVGGINAIFEDFGNAIADKLPLFIGAVVLLSALLLLAVFRSVVIPVKAAVMNLLSIGASLGVVTLIFQEGYGADLLGIGTGPIEPFVPILVFAIVFGLSMDYEIFLVSRVQEEFHQSGDASNAVARGVATTGRVITAAAAIMVLVFASFALGDDRIIKLFGIGLASAIFIDALIIRCLLVPALMELLGRSAWFMPRWLERIVPKLDLERSKTAAR